MRRLILRNFQSPGDILMLTAAVRDLHRCYPGQFRTDVRTSCPQLWQHNPWLTPLSETGRGVQVLDCHYPLIHQANEINRHFIHGFIDDLNRQLDVDIQLSAFRGDVHLDRAERTGPGPVERLVGMPVPYWVIVAGGKYDFTIKWWHFRRYQQVVDHFRGRLLFVQVGEAGHYHPDLSGVLDFRGRTDTRQLIQLVYHAEGVLCPVTFLMHLAAAVPRPPGRAAPRPCVVIAGGREPPAWEAYPQHQFLHTISQLPCCRAGGCWRSRIVPLGDGDEKDQPHHLCTDVVDGLPRCMAMITPDMVVCHLEQYYRRRQIHYLTSRQFRRAAVHCRKSRRETLLAGQLAE